MKSRQRNAAQRWNAENSQSHWAHDLSRDGNGMKMMDTLQHYTVNLISDGGSWV